VAFCCKYIFTGILAIFVAEIKINGEKDGVVKDNYDE